MGRWLFVTAASPDIGYGHVSRTRLLAREAHRLGLDVDVVTSPGTAPGGDLGSAPRWHEAEITPDLVHEFRSRGSRAHVVVMDAPDDWLTRFAGMGRSAPDAVSPLVAVFRSDGPPSIGDTFEHVSLTPTFETPQVTDVDGPSGSVRRWTGRDLIFVRQSVFLDDATSKEVPPRIVLTMGGADPREITWQVCTALQDAPLSAPVSVVVGALNPRADAIDDAFGDRFEVVRQGTFDFDDLLKRASVAIVNAGLTRYECIAAETPFVAISMNERQASFTELVVDQGFGAHAGVIGRPALQNTVETVHEWLSRPAAVHEMRQVGRGMLNPMNPRHLVQQLATWERVRRNGDHR